MPQLAAIMRLMFCPFCNHRESRVLESRLTTENSVRRRRECESCGKRFTTYEKLEAFQFLVVKRSGTRDPFSRDKLRAGISRACVKTTVSAEQIDNIIDEVENELISAGRREISSSLLGEFVLSKLSSLDQVAYVRFASVYRAFRSVDDFIAELNLLKNTLSGSSSARSRELMERAEREERNLDKEKRSSGQELSVSDKEKRVPGQEAGVSDKERRLAEEEKNATTGSGKQRSH